MQSKIWKRTHNIKSYTNASKITNSTWKVKAGNTFENLLDESRLIRYSLYWAKEITKKLCKNIINSVKS